jgi:hypothetical protein
MTSAGEPIKRPNLLTVNGRELLNLIGFSNDDRGTASRSLHLGGACLAVARGGGTTSGRRRAAEIRSDRVQIGAHLRLDQNLTGSTAVCRPSGWVREKTRR